MPNKKQVILGVDPGYGRVGWGVITNAMGNDWQVVNYGCIETSLKKDFPDRLFEVHKEVEKIIKKYKPSRMALEDLFFSKNVKTAIKVGQARGAIMLTAVQNGLPVDEFTPLQVKQGITGYGKAEKMQMQKMVAMILGLKEKVKSDDAADALAVALCSGQSLWNKALK